MKTDKFPLLTVHMFRQAEPWTCLRDNS